MTSEKDTVTIRSCSVKNEDGTKEPYAYSVHQHGRQHGFFDVNEYDMPELAKDAAQALAARLEVTPWVSPYVAHRKIILADYSTAAKLRRYVMSLYNGHAFPCDLSDIAGMDGKHFEIFCDLVKGYHTLGENDGELIKLAEYIRKEFGVKTAQ